MGYFWLPDDPARRVTGRVNFDGTSIELSLFDNLTVVEMPPDGLGLGHPQRETHPRIFGRLIEDGDDDTSSVGLGNAHHVTLVDAVGMVLNLPAEELTQRWDIDCIILGAHTIDTATKKARLHFDALKGWANPPFLAGGYRRDGVVTADITESVLHQAVTADATYRVLSSAEGVWGLDVHLDRRTWIEVEALNESPFGGLHSKWIRSIHDLLIVCIGGPVALSEVRVEVGSIWGGTKWAALVFRATQDTSRRDISAFRLREHGTLALLFPEDEPADFSYFVPEWLQLRDDLAKVIEPMTSIFYSASIYSEHRYANTFKAAEELAKRSFETSDLPKAQHQERVEMILGASRDACVPDAHIDWAERVLRSRNDSPLRVLIEKLIDDTGEVGAAINRAIPGAAQRMSAARTAVSHGGMKTDTTQQQWLGALLMLVLRLHVLREIGLEPSVVESRVLTSRSFQRALRALQPQNR
ncbi:HEPN domain-containing protein [Knoellia sp. S7-12]|uniref:ApeA N-terminal domain 1-containing protein n=1 Tax=Knoellia sp. S7-12 TaxID=3126698 RepID=UPI0033676FC5